MERFGRFFWMLQFSVQKNTYKTPTPQHRMRRRKVLARIFHYSF